MAREIFLYDVTLDDKLVIDGKPPSQVVSLRRDPHTGRYTITTTTGEVTGIGMDLVLATTRLDEAKLEAVTEAIYEQDVSAHYQDALQAAVEGPYKDSAQAGRHAVGVAEALRTGDDKLVKRDEVYR